MQPPHQARKIHGELAIQLASGQFPSTKTTTIAKSIPDIQRLRCDRSVKIKRTHAKVVNLKSLDINQILIAVPIVKITSSLAQKST